MKISEKIRELTDRAQKLAFPDQDDIDINDWVSMSITPMDGVDGFQIWFDRWHLFGTTAYHRGMFMDYFVEGTTLIDALTYMEEKLDDEDDRLVSLIPKTIVQYGHTYQLVK